VKIKISSLVLLIVTLYGVNYFIFERIFFFNEVLSLIGFIFFIKYSFTQRGIFLIPRSGVYRDVLALIFLGLVYAAISIPLKTNWYYYFRGLSIVYSMFSFFIGYQLYENQFSFFNKIRKTIYGYALLAFGLRWGGLIDRNAYSFWFALLQKNWRLAGLFIFTLIMAFYFLSFTSATVVLVLAVIVAALIIRSYAYFKLFALIFFLGFVLLFAAAVPYLKYYKTNTTLFFGDVVSVYNKHPYFNLDHNTSWRFIFWYRTVVEPFPQNLAGIGVGTPLLPYLPNQTTTDLNYPDEYIAHVIGTHNTFITLFVRFGIASTLLFALIYRSVFREFFIYKKYYRSHKNDFSLFMAFFALTGVGLFNLLLETPTLASLYWVSLGFVAQAIYIRKNQNA